MLILESKLVAKNCSNEIARWILFSVLNHCKDCLAIKEQIVHYTFVIIKPHQRFLCPIYLLERNEVF